MDLVTVLGGVRVWGIAVQPGLSRSLRAAALASTVALTGCATAMVEKSTPNESGTYSKLDAGLAHGMQAELLANVLRSRDHLPLSFSDVTSITHQYTQTETAALTAPFGILGGTTRTIAPGLTAVTAPTATFTSLNNQVFWSNALQPANVGWIKTEWSANDSSSGHAAGQQTLDAKAPAPDPNASNRNRLLFMLLVKSVRFSGDQAVWNDPSSPNFTAFSRLASDIFLKGKPQLGILTFEEPVGPPIKIGTTVSVQKTVPNPANKPSSSTQTTTNERDLSWISTVTGLGDASYHLGNADCDSGVCLAVQLYRQYPNQSVLCLDQTTLGHRLYSKASEDATKDLAERSGKNSDLFVSYALSSAAVASLVKPTGGGHSGGATGAPAGGTSSPTASTTAASTTATPSSTSGGTSESSSAPTTAINRISAIVPLATCDVEEIIAQPALSEDQFAKSTASFAQIEWRSPIQVLEYLGALARLNGQPSDWPTGVPFPFQVSAGDDADVYDAKSDDDGKRISTTYGSKRYYVQDDVSNEAMAILAAMFNSQKGTNPPPTVFIGPP